jgi:hypothetical protein
MTGDGERQQIVVVGVVTHASCPVVVVREPPRA